MKTKSIRKYFMLVIAILFMSNTMNAQKDEEIRIKVLKKIDGKTQVIDTIIPMPNDSVFAFWAAPRSIKFDLKTDSIMAEVQQRLKEINMDSIMEQVEKNIQKMDIHMKKLNDSVIQHKLKGIEPRIRKIDSIHKYHLEMNLKRLDSLSNIDFDFKFKMNPDSLLQENRERIIMLDSMNLKEHLPDPAQLQEIIQNELAHGNFFILNRERLWKSDEKSEWRNIQGKAIKIKTDGNGNIVKVIIMSPDGETVDVKKGEEAYRFVTENEEITVSKEGNTKDLSDADKRILKKKGYHSTGELELLDFKIFPNPAEGSFRLRFGLKKQEQVTLSIINQKGELIYSEAINPFPGEYNKEIVLDAKNETCLIQIKQGNRAAVKKVMIK